MSITQSNGIGSNYCAFVYEILKFRVTNDTISVGDTAVTLHTPIPTRFGGGGYFANMKLKVAQVGVGVGVAWAE